MSCYAGDDLVVTAYYSHEALHSGATSLNLVDNALLQVCGA